MVYIQIERSRNGYVYKMVSRYYFTNLLIKCSLFRSGHIPMMIFIWAIIALIFLVGVGLSAYFNIALLMATMKNINIRKYLK